MSQTLEAMFHQGDQRRVDHTPSGAAVACGQIVNLGGLIGVCTSPEGIADESLGSLDVSGMYRVKKASGGGVTFAQGSLVEWDDTNNTAVAQAAGDFDVGVAIEAAGDADDHVKVWTNKKALQ